MLNYTELIKVGVEKCSSSVSENFEFETKKLQKCLRFLVKLVQQINFTLPTVFLIFLSFFFYFAIFLHFKDIKPTKKSGLTQITHFIIKCTMRRQKSTQFSKQKIKSKNLLRITNRKKKKAK